MDVVLVIIGALFVIWPWQYRRSMRRIHKRISQRGGDVDRFDRAMDGPAIQIGLWMSPVLGVILIAFGVLD